MNNSVDIQYGQVIDLNMPLSSVESIKGESCDKKKKKMEKVGSDNKKDKKSTKYHWTSTEHKKYIKFLQLNPNIFEMSLALKKGTAIHLQLSKFIRSRNSTQCRSHHQKMIKRYGTVRRIIEQRPLQEQISMGNPLKATSLKLTVETEEVKEAESFQFNWNAQYQQSELQQPMRFQCNEEIDPIEWNNDYFY